MSVGTDEHRAVGVEAVQLEPVVCGILKVAIRTYRKDLEIRAHRAVECLGGGVPGSARGPGEQHKMVVEEVER